MGTDIRFPSMNPPKAASPTLSSGSSLFCPSRQYRPHTLSVLSVRSNDSARLNVEPRKAEPTIVASNSVQSLACGSFVPNMPAAATLRNLFPPTDIRGRSKDIISSHQKPKVEWSLDSPVPYITRTLPLSFDSRSPSPVRPCLAFPKTRKAPRTRKRPEVQTQTSELHSILADLEQKSKFFLKKELCATCRKSGSGFPKCSRCGEMWCSRECRTKGGRKHECRTTGRS